jgi:predicted site-specific integrase-resolvase
MADRWLTTTEYALKYGLHGTTVALWARQGKIKAVRKGREWCVYDPGIFEVANPNLRVVTSEDLIPLVRGEEAAELLGIPTRTLRYHAQHGEVGFRLQGHRRRYSIQDIRDLMAFRAYNRTRVPRKEKRLTVMKWARLRLGMKPPTSPETP